MAETMTTASIKKPTVKIGEFDITKRVEQVTTDKHPFRKEGEVIRVSQLAADKNKLNGWAK